MMIQQRENLSKQIKMKKQTLELKSIVTNENFTRWAERQLERAEESENWRMNNMSYAIWRTERKNLKKNEQSLRGLWENSSLTIFFNGSLNKSTKNHSAVQLKLMYFWYVNLTFTKVFF